MPTRNGVPLVKGNVATYGRALSGSAAPLRRACVRLVIIALLACACLLGTSPVAASTSPWHGWNKPTGANAYMRPKHNSFDICEALSADHVYVPKPHAEESGYVWVYDQGTCNRWGWINKKWLTCDSSYTAPKPSSLEPPRHISYSSFAGNERTSPGGHPPCNCRRCKPGASHCQNKFSRLKCATSCSTTSAHKCKISPGAAWCAKPKMTCRIKVPLNNAQCYADPGLTHPVGPKFCQTTLTSATLLVITAPQTCFAAA
jgi:hypothetical protein